MPSSASLLLLSLLSSQFDLQDGMVSSVVRTPWCGGGLRGRGSVGGTPVNLWSEDHCEVDTTQKGLGKAEPGASRNQCGGQEPASVS